jgi:hypothetical protein
MMMKVTNMVDDWQSVVEAFRRQKEARGRERCHSRSIKQHPQKRFSKKSTIFDQPKQIFIIMHTGFKSSDFWQPNLPPIFVCDVSLVGQNGNGYLGMTQELVLPQNTIHGNG